MMSQAPDFIGVTANLMNDTKHQVYNKLFELAGVDDDSMSCTSMDGRIP